jgi:hypothetical protein
VAKSTQFGTDFAKPNTFEEQAPEQWQKLNGAART